MIAFGYPKYPWPCPRCPMYRSKAPGKTIEVRSKARS